MRRINPEAPLTQSQRNKRFYERHREAELARNKEYYAKKYETNGDDIRASRRNSRHRITTEWFDSKIIEQNNRCAVCRQIFVKTPHIDHRHGCCGSIRSCNKCRRGILCEDCNLGIGRFKDSIEFLTNAIQYLKEWNNNGHQA